MSAIITGITDSEISIAAIHESITDTSHGGEAFFLGCVRNNNVGRTVQQMEYHAHKPLAENIFREICEELLNTFGPKIKICVYHRTGMLQISDISVAIGVSTPHRDESFRACRQIIEEIKHRVPIWKKEYYTDGESDWVQGCSLCEPKAS